MAKIPFFSNIIKNAVKRTVKSAVRSVIKVVSDIVTRGMVRQDAAVVDIVDTLKSADPEAIAEKLHQSAFTTKQILKKESSVLAWPKSKLLPRNLIVSGKLKSGSNYRVFFQADKLDADGNFLSREWKSMYANTQKAFSEWESDIDGMLNPEKYKNLYSFGNYSFHHVLHQRGAPFLPVQPR